ncbi:hypothetical protein C8A05DRAFT_13617 [Staphylotrichum tortipilum]|uniref:Uncharacterized protein n=1 Tax=Staphylotrichum tortipilum TaxID=2831512 RepID=A0AAN6RVH2_9PEZI|nr:hypothetical protein C8A05DRAFT_13617 [Staphylotrichum longicolle]
MGDYTRHSSQPATADLVRADLGEIFSNDWEAESLRRAPSVSAVSDMLDLEPASTPAPRPSKAARNDPLPGLLASILESDISSDELAPEPPSPCNVERTPSPSGRRPNLAKQPRANVNKRTRTKPQPKTADSPRESPASSPRRQSPPTGSAGASSTSRHHPTKPSAQTKKRKQTAKQAPSQPKGRTRKHDKDMYELSDATDTETESPPKKRRAKQPSSKEPRPPPARKSQLANEGATQVDSAVTQAKRKPARVPKKPAGRGSVPQETKVAAKSTSPATSESSDQVDESDIPPVQEQQDTTTAIAEPNSKKRSPPEPVLEADHRDVVSPPPPKPLPVASREPEPALPVVPKAQHVIILSSESDEDPFPPAGSTSPLFMAREEPLISSGSPEAAVMVNSGISPSRGWQPRLPTRNTRIGPAASFRSRTLPKHSAMPGLHGITHTFPAGIRDAFLSDEQPAANPPSPSPEVEAHPDEEGLCAGDMWEEAVDGGSLPAVLHKIITRLHRSMKPREEVVREIVAEYHENALRLLDNLRVRHDHEKTSTLVGLQKASRAASSIFALAGQDLADLINSLQEMDVARTADALTRPILALKLESVAQLCQTRLEDYTIGKPGGDLGTEPQDSLDGLAQTYQTKLFAAVGRNTAEGPNDVDAQVDDFITGCLSEEITEIRHTEVKKPVKSVKPARNADDALEVLLDGIMHTLQKTTGTSAQSDLGNDVVDEEDREIADIDLLGDDSGLHALFSRGNGLTMA